MTDSPEDLNEERIEISFAKVFPPTDLLGHFVIALSAAMNDLLLSNKLLAGELEDRFTPAERIAILRMVVGQIWETVELVRAADKVDQIKKFLDGLATASNDPTAVTVQLALLRGQTGSWRGPIRNVLRTTRNKTWHYPKPGDEGLGAALTAFAEAEDKGLLRFGPKMPSIRAEFADDILLDLAFAQPLKVRPVPKATLSQLFKDLSEGVVAIIHLAQWIGVRYLNERPEGWRKLEPGEPASGTSGIP